ncbi:MAG: 3-hydroxyacyl-CoA dehydrogenase, partial [Planctomycetota bacterium]
MSTDTVAVIGAGTMGSGIAQKLAQEGSHVLLVDRTDADVARGRERIETMLAEGVERKIFTPERAAQVLARVEGTLDFGRLAECDLVIEAVFENLEVKRDLFRRLGECTRPETVLATNTSSFYVRQVAEVTKNPERVLGLHYFYHPAKNRLVEVVPHEGTDPAATRRAWAFQERVGKTPIASADAPGFVVNRFFVPWLNEAVRLLDEGVADIPTIEAAAKEAFGIGMGPFQLMNVTGVPIALHAATTLGRELGPFYAPGDRLRAQVESKELWPLEGEAGDQGREEARERLLGTVFHVAAALVDEDVSTIEDTDIGARVGLRWRVGPFELANEVGVGEAARMARRAVEAYGLPAPKALTEQAASGQPFTIRVCALACEGGVATITINRPDALNAL